MRSTLVFLSDTKQVEIHIRSKTWTTCTQIPHKRKVTTYHTHTHTRTCTGIPSRTPRTEKDEISLSLSLSLQCHPRTTISPLATCESEGTSPCLGPAKSLLGAPKSGTPSLYHEGHGTSISQLRTENDNAFTYGNNIDERRFPRVLEAHESQFHLLLPEEALEPV